MFKSIFFLFLVISNTYSMSCGMSDSQWNKCTKSSECIISKGACSKHAVNKEYKIESEKYQECMSAYIECAKPPADYEKLKYKAICKEGNCTLVQDS